MDMIPPSPSLPSAKVPPHPFTAHFSRASNPRAVNTFLTRELERHFTGRPCETHFALLVLCIADHECHFLYSPRSDPGKAKKLFEASEAAINKKMSR
jgi:hypothetical protein